jgi:hypothetical protein
MHSILPRIRDKPRSWQGDKYWVCRDKQIQRSKRPIGYGPMAHNRFIAVWHPLTERCDGRFAPRDKRKFWGICMQMLGNFGELTGRSSFRRRAHLLLTPRLLQCRCRLPAARRGASVINKSLNTATPTSHNTTDHKCCDWDYLVHSTVLNSQYERRRLAMYSLYYNNGHIVQCLSNKTISGCLQSRKLP